MILMIETFYGGSHRAFADGYLKHSAQEIDLVTLPGERWRRRMRTGAFEIWPQMSDLSRYTVILVTDLIDLPDLLALWRTTHGKPAPPVLLYMHETQTTYPAFSGPIPHGRRTAQAAGTTRPARDAERLAALQDIKNCLVADRVLFNSSFHREAFLDAVRGFAASDSELALPDAARQIEAKSGVVYPGVELAALPGTEDAATAAAGTGASYPGAAAAGPVAAAPTHASFVGRASVADRAYPATSREPDSRPPRLLWNHRWDFDKRPGHFFRAAEALADRGRTFELVVLGEAVWESEAIEHAREVLAGRIVHWGYAPDRDTYWRLLSACDIVVSTAVQENFGISVVEAVGAGCIPVLPKRLSYPEIIPVRYHSSVFYQEDDDLVPHLERVLSDLPSVRHACRGLAETMTRYRWQQIAAELDAELDSLRSLTGS